MRLVLTLLLVAMLPGCITAKPDPEDAQAVAKGEKALVVFEVYQMEPPLPLMAPSRFDGQARLEALGRREGKRSFEYLTLGKPEVRLLDPGDYAITELLVGKSWTREENAPFAVFRVRGGEVLYLGTFEHVQDYKKQHASHVTANDIALVDRSDLEAARERLARVFPELARKLKSRPLKSDFIRARRPKFDAE